MPSINSTVRWRRILIPGFGKKLEVAFMRQKLRQILASSTAILAPAVAPALILLNPEQAAAQAVTDVQTGLNIPPIDILYFSLVIGAISATMISAVWLIRERSKIEQENTQLRAELRNIQADKGRYQALMTDADQKLIVWEGRGKPVEVMGDLPNDAGAPSREGDLLNFSSWMDVQSTTALNDAIDGLKSNAERFDIIIQTINRTFLEVQGRVSGRFAFVRIVPLGDVRQEQASLLTERDRLLGALETFQQLLDVVEMPVWMRGSDGRLAWVNDAYCHATEAKSRQSAIDDGSELFGVKALENIKAVSTPERPFYDKLSTVVRGSRRFFDVADTKSKSGSAGLAVDVTAEEEVRSELENTLQSHINVVNHISIPVAIFDRQQQLQFYNQAFSDLWQLSDEYLNSKPDNNALFERLRADGKLSDQPTWHDWKDEVLSIYTSVEMQQNFWHLADGQTLHVVANANPQGGVIWAFENVTEKMDLETKYNRLQQVQGQTIDHLAEGVCVFASDGTLRLSNPAFRALWALTEEQTQSGMHIKTIVPECEKSYRGTDGWRRFADIITSLDDTRIDHEGRMELDTGLILDFSLVPLTGGLTMITFVNMSDNVRAERMLTEKNEALIKAESLKNDFVQHVSYELRSPLTNIMGFTDLVRTPEFGALNDRQSEYLDHIATSSSVLLTIVNDILDLATVDAGIMKLELGEVDIARLVQETERQINDRMKEGGFVLKTDISAAPSTMPGDHQRLKQILVKLLGNAASASPKGSDIKLTCYENDGHMCFEVQDHGVGISQDEIDQVFNRFESKGKNGHRGGAGLGLSIVKSFVGLHNGKVNIDSVVGEGTKVTCSIPLDVTSFNQMADPIYGSVT